MRSAVSRGRIAAMMAAPFLLGLGASSSAAEKFPVAGNYGNREGCKVAANQPSSSDNLLYLTPELVATYATLCTPLAIWSAGATDIVAPVTCGHEGEGTITVDHVRLRKLDAPRDAYEIFSADGNSWGEAERCR